LDLVLLNLTHRLNLNFLKTESETDIKLLKQIIIINKLYTVLFKVADMLCWLTHKNADFTCITVHYSKLLTTETKYICIKN